MPHLLPETTVNPSREGGGEASTWKESGLAPCLRCERRTDVRVCVECVSYRFNRSLPPAAFLQPSFCDTGRLASVELPQGVADAVCHQALPLGIGVQPVRHQLDLYLFVTWAVTNQAKGRELARFSGGGQLEHQRLMWLGSRMLLF